MITQQHINAVLLIGFIFVIFPVLVAVYFKLYSFGLFRFKRNDN